MPQWLDALKLISQKNWLYLGVAGLLLILVASGAGSPKFYPQLAPSWQTRLFVVGLILEVACLIVIIVDMLTPRREAKLRASVFGITIIRPENRETLSLPIRFNGSLTKTLPENFELWICTFRDGTPTMYWPQMKVNVGDQSWEFTLREHWAFSKNELNYKLMIVGENGQILIDQYFELNERYRRMKGGWLGPITKMTKDMVICPESRVVFWKDYKPE